MGAIVTISDIENMPDSELAIVYKQAIGGLVDREAERRDHRAMFESDNGLTHLAGFYYLIIDEHKKRGLK